MLKINSNYGTRKTKFDPAPSRFSYSLQRLWLRKYIRSWALLLLILFVGGSAFFYLSIKTDLEARTRAGVDYLIERLTSSPALRISKINVISTDVELAKRIETFLAIKLPIESLDFDVESLKRRVESVPAVKQANVRLTAEGFVEIRIIERQPVAVHKINGKFLIVDIDGVAIDELTNRSVRSDLPLIVGEGANFAVEEALRLLIASEGILPRIRGLVRVGTLRWDMSLDRDQIIRLPEQNPINAIKKVLSLQEVSRILDRDISYFDFRDMKRPLVGLDESSSEALQKIREILIGDNV